ncbi:hypothetical protein GWK47_020923 [Chionoecetes opilio]|uniref:Uncharacterized protein n=1 Tax=Chionoecetes opilio TaxID=41210 RepID=A0A8J5CEQ3_CHIOP|nr:hypothetical protein GWK47_020923 [Chionoecetes opilio]
MLRNPTSQGKTMLLHTASLLTSPPPLTPAPHMTKPLLALAPPRSCCYPCRHFAASTTADCHETFKDYLCFEPHSQIEKLHHMSPPPPRAHCNRVVPFRTPAPRPRKRKSLPLFLSWTIPDVRKGAGTRTATSTLTQPQKHLVLSLVQPHTRLLVSNGVSKLVGNKVYGTRSSPH